LNDQPKTPKINGQDLYLTIDLELQAFLENAFPDTFKGSAIVINPVNGNILAMLSSPPFDPNIFSLSRQKKKVEWQNISLNKKNPLLNRIMGATYEPGSTFKIITLMAGLNEGFITPRTTFSSCTGSFKFGSRYFKCHRKSGHGKLSAVGAIKASCNVYFYQLGLLIGVDIINKYARMFGLGAVTGLDPEVEKKGVLLDEATYKKRFKNRPGWHWSKGQILNCAIGQGQVVTPLQLCNYAAGLGNMTYIFKPSLAMTHLGRFNESLNQDKIIQKIELKPEVKEIIRKAMVAVVNEAGGTARRARVKDVAVGGKTGTAQNPGGADHALFIAVAPMEKPEIAISVIIENAGKGGGARVKVEVPLPLLSQALL